MNRKHKVDEIHLQIDALIPFANKKYVGFTIQWSSDIGFGEYQVYQSNGSKEWEADSEHMDNNDDKEFIKELMRLFVERLKIQA